MRKTIFVNAAALALMAPPRDAGQKAPAASTNPTPTAGVTGAALLAEVANSEGGELFMTQAEAAEGIAAGHFVADPARADGDRAPVKLTDAGFAAFQGSNEGDAAQAAARQSAPASTASTGFEIEDAVAIPTDTGVRRGRSGGYPFDALQVGQSFHVTKGADGKDPAEKLASSVSGARAKYAVADADGKTEEVTVKTYQKDAAGEYVKVDGKRVVVSETKETRPVMVLTRNFIVRAVDATDPKGEGARVWRTA